MKKFSMKKTTAAAVAAAVGAALLLGGAGTLAYWSDTETSATQSISSGTLNLDAATGGAWSVKKSTAAPAVVFGPNDTVVPGDILSTTINVPAQMVGNNLKANLTITPSLPTGTLTVPVKLAVGSGTAATLTAAPIVREVTPTSLGTVAVTVSIEFPVGADNTTMTKTLNAISFTYSLQQIANS